MNYLEDLNDRENFLIREANKKIFILDSSVILKWFYKKDEDNTDTAGLIYDKASSRDFYLISPELLIYEVLNIFRYRTDIGKIELEGIIQRIIGILVITQLDNKVYLNAYDISVKIGESVYDSIYIAISEKFRAPLLTADKKLYDKARSSGYNVVLLKDFAGFY